MRKLAGGGGILCRHAHSLLLRKRLFNYFKIAVTCHKNVPWNRAGSVKQQLLINTLSVVNVGVCIQIQRQRASWRDKTSKGNPLLKWQGYTHTLHSTPSHVQYSSRHLKLMLSSILQNKKNQLYIRTRKLRSFMYCRNRQQIDISTAWCLRTPEQSIQ